MHLGQKLIYIFWSHFYISVLTIACTMLPLITLQTQFWTCKSCTNTGKIRMWYFSSHLHGYIISKTIKFRFDVVSSYSLWWILLLLCIFLALKWFMMLVRLTCDIPSISICHFQIKIVMRITTRLKSSVGIWPDKFHPKHSLGPDWCCRLCLLRVSEVWRLFAQDLRRWINSLPGSDLKLRLVYKIWYFCYYFTNFGQLF